MSADWVKRFGYWMAPSPTRPGIYRLAEGGYFIRARVLDPKTGKLRAVMRALHRATVQEAQAELDLLRSEKRAEMNGLKPQRQLFCDFAVSRFEAKVTAGDIRSAKGREKWESILRVHLLPEFGQMRCDEIRAWHVEQWRTRVAKMMADGYGSSRKLKSGKTQTRFCRPTPNTANTWIAVLRTLGGEMTTLLELDRNPAAALQFFDTTQRPTYTDEDPNSLTPDKAREFLSTTQRLFPQHFAMTLLGFVTGKRPSTMRPLRRRGGECDIDWTEGFVRFRRSNTRGDEMMQGTKTGTRERVYVPDAVLQALREHIARLEDPSTDPRAKPPLWWRKEMPESDLLFPGRDGGPRSPSCLDKPFARVSREIGLAFELTPMGMRRTFNDLARQAHVHDIVIRSITGHLTPEMQVKYSTANAAEQRQAIAKVIDLVALRRERKEAANV
jgi:integrase